MIIYTIHGVKYYRTMTPRLKIMYALHTNIYVDTSKKYTVQLSFVPDMF